jgi:hypothetical protein
MSSRRILAAHLACLALVGPVTQNTPAHGQITQQWLTQWGTESGDSGGGLAVDATGTMWVTGTTGGSLGGPNADVSGLSSDIFLTPLSATGVRGTSVQRGGDRNELGLAAAVVGGNKVFAVGATLSGTWNGAAALGNQDALAVGYSTAGVWASTTRVGSTGTDFANGAAGNGSNLLLVGTSNGTVDGQPGFSNGSDAFISKRTSTGALVWTRIVGTGYTDQGSGAAFDTVGNAYIGGTTSGNFPGFTLGGYNDLFIARYDTNGNQTLLKQWGSNDFDVTTDIAVDVSGNIYVTGYTQGALGGQTNSGASDAFVAKLDSNGNVLWTRLFGGSGSDLGSGVALDAAGNVWMGGSSRSSIFGHSNAGVEDAFVASYNSAGTLLGTFFWGTASAEQINDLAGAPDGSMRVTGSTRGSLGATNAGSLDAFAASLTTVPEPASATLLLGSAAVLLLRRRRW